MLVRTLVLAELLTAGEEIAIRVDDPADVPTTAHLLIRLAAAIARRGDLNAAEAITEARGVIEKLDGFMGFPISDVDLAEDAAQAAVELMASSSGLSEATWPLD